MLARRWWIALVAGCGVVAGLIVIVVMQPPAPPPVPVLHAKWIDCPFAVPDGERARCGTVSVPQYWQRRDDRPIELFFAVTKATGPRPKLDPIVVLNGGPGQAASDLIEDGWQAKAALRRDRDIVYVDQRGTGRSRPGLFCRQLDPVAFWHGGLTAADAEACLKPIREAGFDPAAFNTVESARDLNGLKVAIGSDRWNILGTSYGTILAMEMVRADPGGVRSVVLNSPTLSPRASWLDLARMAAIKRVYQSVFAACRTQPACDRAFPHLDAVFKELARALTDHPLPITYTDPRNGRTATAELNFPALLDILTVMVGSGQSAAMVPQLIWHLHRAAIARDDSWPELVAWIYMPQPYWKIMDVVAYGLNAAIGCREVRPWVDADSARAAGMLYVPYVAPASMERDYDVFCPVWNLPKAPEAIRAPVVSAVPTLLLTGDFDTLTPTGYAEIVARTLSRHQLLRFHGFGHDVLSVSACARDVVERFLDDPDQPADLPCVAQSEPPRFAVPPAAEAAEAAEAAAQAPPAAPPAALPVESQAPAVSQAEPQTLPTAPPAAAPPAVLSATPPTAIGGPVPLPPGTLAPVPMLADPFSRPPSAAAGTARSPETP